jgi:hypothetical protein
MQFINPEEAGWGRLFYFLPWEVWLVTRPNRSHWARLCVRLKDPLASRRSWHLYWNDHERRGRHRIIWLSITPTWCSKSCSGCATGDRNFRNSRNKTNWK